MYQMKRYGTVTFVYVFALSTWFVFSQLYSLRILNLTRLNLSADCGGMCLNWVYRHPSELSVPDVPTAVPPKLQPY